MEYALTFLLLQITAPPLPIDEQCKPLCFAYAAAPEPGFFANNVSSFWEGR